MSESTAGAAAARTASTHYHLSLYSTHASVTAQNGVLTPLFLQRPSWGGLSHTMPLLRSPWQCLSSTYCKDPMLEAVAFLDRSHSQNG